MLSLILPSIFPFSLYRRRGEELIFPCHFILYMIILIYLSVFGQLFRSMRFSFLLLWKFLSSFLLDMDWGVWTTRIGVEMSMSFPLGGDLTKNYKYLYLLVAFHVDEYSIWNTSFCCIFMFWDVSYEYLSLIYPTLFQDFFLYLVSYDHWLMWCMSLR